MKNGDKVAEQTPDFEMFGGPLDGSFYSSPPPECDADVWFWELKESKRWALYQWMGWRWNFIKVVKDKPEKWK